MVKWIPKNPAPFCGPELDIFCCSGAITFSVNGRLSRFANNNPAWTVALNTINQLFRDWPHTMQGDHPKNIPFVYMIRQLCRLWKVLCLKFKFFLNKMSHSNYPVDPFTPHWGVSVMFFLCWKVRRRWVHFYSNYWLPEKAWHWIPNGVYAAAGGGGIWNLEKSELYNYF